LRIGWRGRVTYEAGALWELDGLFLDPDFNSVNSVPVQKSGRCPEKHTL